MNKDKILQFCWKYKLFGTHLYTENRKPIEVVDQGLYDRNHGSRFFNAKVKIDGLLFVGNVLVLDFSHEFFDSFKDYKTEASNVILVVCNVADQQCINTHGEVKVIPTVVVEVPDIIQRNYDVLTGDKGMIHCHRHIKEYTSRLGYHAWLAALQTEHLEEESENCRKLKVQHGGDWQWAFTGQLFKAFGFGVNDDTMSVVYSTIPSRFLASSCIDDLFQVEAVVLGQAGLLDPETIPNEYQEKALMEGYFAKLRNEWLYLAHKYQMPKPGRYEWKPLGRGQHISPHVLLSMLANLLYMRKTVVGQLTDVKSLDDLYHFVTTSATLYWQMRSQFGVETEKCDKPLTRDRQSRILMTCHIPLLFAYGREKMREDLCDLAFDLMEQMKPYRTHEIASFERFGIKPETAGDSVALCRLKDSYCDRRDCLRCRFGLEFVKKHEPNTNNQ